MRKHLLEAKLRWGDIGDFGLLRKIRRFSQKNKGKTQGKDLFLCFRKIS